MKRLVPVAIALASMGAPAAGRDCLMEDPANPSVCLWKRQERKTWSVVSAPEAKVLLASDRKVVCKSAGPGKCRRTSIVPITLVVSAHGFADELVTVDGRQSSVSVELKPCPDVRFPAGFGKSSPITVKVDGKIVGAWPGDFPEGASLTAAMGSTMGSSSQTCALPAGRHTISLSNPVYLPNEVQVELTNGEVKDLDVEMRRRAGSILVVSPLGDVEVLIDGVSRGKLPPAGAGDITAEIPVVEPGRHSVELAFPNEGKSDLTPKDQWGEFRHQAEAVEVKEQEVATVSFVAPPLRGRFQDPVWLTMNRSLLGELCELQNGDACLALGWSYRWGVGGPADNERAAALFKGVCRSTLEARKTSANTSRTGPRERIADDVAGALDQQACAAYDWMALNGLAGAAVAPISALQPICGSEGLSDDPITPCVRSHLSLESKKANDPTLYVAHTSFQHNATPGLSPSLVLAAGSLQRMQQVGFAFAAADESYSVDVTLRLGLSQTHRWDPAFASQIWAGGLGVAEEVGFQFQPVPHAYGLIHFDIGGTWVRANHQTWGGFVYGTRIAAGLTRGIGFRRSFFIEAGIYLQGMPHQLFEPTVPELLSQLHASGNVDQLTRSLGRTNDGYFFVATPSLVLGWKL